MSVEWNVEEAERAEFNLPNVATLQFDRILQGQRIHPYSPGNQ